MRVCLWIVLDLSMCIIDGMTLPILADSALLIILMSVMMTDKQQ